MSNQLAKQTSDLRSLLSSDKMRRQFALALPKHCTPERFCRISLTALTRTPKLAECTQQSVMKCLLELSSLGIEPDGRRAHLIPYGKECTLVVDYKGLYELVMRSGEVAVMHCDLVHEKDHFERGCDMERGPYLQWKPANGDRGECLGAFSMVKMKEGGAQWEYMTREQIEGIRKRSKAGNNGPWVTDWEEMARKTVFRRHAKRLPIASERLRDAIEIDDGNAFADAIEVQSEPDEGPSKPKLKAPNEAPKELPAKEEKRDSERVSLMKAVDGYRDRLGWKVADVERLAVQEGIAEDGFALTLYSEQQLEGLLEVMEGQQS